MPMFACLFLILEDVMGGSSGEDKGRGEDRKSCSDAYSERVVE